MGEDRGHVRRLADDGAERRGAKLRQAREHVADAAAADVAVAIHSAMRRGQAPDVALGSCVRRAIAEERVDLVAAAASFTCVAARGN